MCRPAIEDNPLLAELSELSDFLIAHPPPRQMLWILVETIKNTADVVAVLEEWQAQEMSDEESVA